MATETIAGVIVEVGDVKYMLTVKLFIVMEDGKVKEVDQWIWI